MKQNIDKALRMMCSKDELRPVYAQPWQVGDGAYACNGYVGIRIMGYEHDQYNDDPDKYGKWPNLDDLIANSGEMIGYFLVSMVAEAAEGNNGCVVIGGHRVKAEYMRLVMDAAKVLGIRMLCVHECGNSLLLSTVDGCVSIMAVCYLLEDMESRALPLCDYDKSWCCINTTIAAYNLSEWLERERQERDEEERRRKEYEQGHHKIWKIYIRRTEVGELLVEAPDFETAVKIAEDEASEAEYKEEYDYEVDEYDYEEDIDHDDIQEEYSDRLIATPEKGEYGGYKYVRVSDYEHFD